jgi:hypothetical protein
MRESRLLCLAVSRRDGGNCIAGIDIDSGEWIRPIPAKNRGALGDAEIVVRDDKTQKLRIMTPLDVIQLHLDEPVGNHGQPENWTLAPGCGREPYHVLCRAKDDPLLVARVKDLAEANGEYSLIFGSTDRKIPHSVIAKKSISHSLCVIRPKNLTWIRTTDFHNRPRIEGRFDLGKRNARYCLPLTDIAWEAKLLKQTLGETAVDASHCPGVNAGAELLLTISLGDLFEKTQCHYKLIAGALLLPRNKND